MTEKRPMGFLRKSESSRRGEEQAIKLSFTTGDVWAGGSIYFPKNQLLSPGYFVAGPPINVPEGTRVLASTTFDEGKAAITRGAVVGEPVENNTSPMLEDDRRRLMALLPPTRNVTLPSLADPMVRATIQRIIDLVPRLVESRRAELTEREIATLVEMFFPKSAIAEAEHQINIDNAMARQAFLKSIPMLDSVQIHRASGRTAKNASATASRWKADKRIFGVSHDGRDLFPAFQFRDGQPHPAIAAVLKALPESMSPWQIAFWFASANGMLPDGDPPMARLDDDITLVEAALREGETAFG